MDGAAVVNAGNLGRYGKSEGGNFAEVMADENGFIGADFYRLEGGGARKVSVFRRGI